MNEQPLRDRLRERGLWPHQVDFVGSSLAEGIGARLLLADDVGTGKTVACAALLGELVRQLGSGSRFLIVAPTVLSTMWVRQLREYGNLSSTIVDASRYRYLEAETGVDENPWTAVRYAVSPLDFLKRPDRANAVTSVHWDAVVIDEAHLCRVGTQRGELLHAFWSSTDASRVIAVSATPDTGNSADFEPFRDPKTNLFRRLRSDLLDWNGDRLLPDSDRIVEIAEVDFSPAERTFFDSVNRLTMPTCNPLLRKALLRRAASSLFVIEQSLRRLMAQDTLSEPMSEYTEGAVSPVAEGLDAEAATRPSINQKEIERALITFEQIERDSKWHLCAELLAAALAEGHRHLVVFCAFRDTGSYLVNLCREAGWKPECIVGDLSDEEKIANVNRFREQGGILIVSGIEGPSFGFITYCMHYDWSRASLLGRLGRVHRLSKRPGTVKHCFLTDDVFSSTSAIREALTAS